jgi:hypothetical protein
VFTSIASGSLGHRNQTVLFFACRMFQLDNFWQFRHREIQSGIHAPPVNLRPTFRAVYHPHINLLPPHIYNQSSQLSLPLSRMTEPRSSCPPLLSTVHRLNKSDERVPSSCFSSAVYPAAAQSVAVPASPSCRVRPCGSRLSRRRRTYPKVIALLKCPFPLPDVVVDLAACAPPRRERIL